MPRPERDLLLDLDASDGSAPGGHLLDGDGRLRAWVLLSLLIVAAAIAVAGQVQAWGLFGVGFPQTGVESLWAWLGSKVPLCAMVAVAVWQLHER